MLQNVQYDMMQEVTVLSQSLSRMDTYVKDSKG